MRRLCGGILLLVSLAGAACDPYYEPRPTLIPRPKPYSGPYEDGAEARALVGCYRATYARTRDGRPERRWYFMLDSLGPVPNRPGGGDGTPGARRAHTFEHGRVDVAYWGKTPDGFQIYDGDTLHGRYLDLVLRGGDFHGAVYWHSDTTFGFSVERIAARRIPCPAGGWPPRGPADFPTPAAR